MKAISDTLLWRWLSGNMVGDAKPEMVVQIRTGHFIREYDDNNQWNAVWTPVGEWQTLPGVAEATVEQSFDQNGIAVGTVDLENVYLREATGPNGTYHVVERGWFSPLRAYRAPGRPGARVTPNEWDRLLDTAVEIRFHQGYGDAKVYTYSGLLDSIQASPLPDRIRLSSRDFGQMLADSDLFGWNIDPKMRDPIHFWDRERNQALIDSDSASDRETGLARRKTWVLCDDVTDMVRKVCRWGGFPANSFRMQDTGARLKEPVAFSYTDTYSSVIQKATDLTGYQFFIGAPSTTFPQGRPTFRRPRSQIAFPPVIAEFRDEQMLTGLDWNKTDEPKRSIYRVRGRHETRDRGGVGLGSIREPALLGLYRPPWHTPNSDRDARILRHAIHVEPLYKTQQAVDVAAMLWALASALAATTSNIEIPALPSVEIDDVVAAVDDSVGINTRCWVAHRSETFTTGKDAKWVQTLGVSNLDDPDVVGVVADLHDALVGPQ